MVYKSELIKQQKLYKISHKTTQKRGPPGVKSEKIKESYNHTQSYKTLDKITLC
jgi:hypothetical protein